MRLIASSLVVLFLITGCNLFSPIDPGGSNLDKCRTLNDAHNYADAITVCEAAIKDEPTNADAQLELADVYLSSIGVDIKTLSDIFLNSSNGTVTIDSLAEGIITAGSITMENAVDSKKHAKEAVKAFDDYGALLIGQGVTNANQIATFYGVLSRMCQIAVLMAYADIGPNGDGDGRITKTDICSTIACGISGTICIDSLVSCGGMDNADALEAANALYSIKNELATLGLGNLQKAVDSMASKIIPLPPTFLTSGSILSFFTDPALETYRADAGRELLREIAR